MPEAKSTSLYSYTPEPPKKPPIIKVSCGIGDTDGFPAFDVESETYASKDDSRWGFLITGGAEFHMPLTVFQVTPDGLADKGRIRLGDIILEINEENAKQLTLTQAQEKINATPKKLLLLVKSMEDDDNFEGYEPGEEKSIVLRVPKPMDPPKEFTPTPLLGSRCWHPIMWHDPPEPPKPKKKKTKTELDEQGNEVVIELSEDESSEDEVEEELPHYRIVRNIRRFFSEVGDNHELKNRIIEDMLLALPTASIEARLRAMQRKLSEIAEIPKILSSTLATVSQTFDELMPDDQQQQYRKYSYDEDTVDYELSDGDADGATDDNNDDNKVCAKGSRQSRQSRTKEDTPESDYASEANYTENEGEVDYDVDDNDDYVDGDADADDVDDCGYEHDDRATDNTKSDDEDFLSTSYTWNLRNVPKLQLNDERNEFPSDNDDEDDVSETKVTLKWPIFVREENTPISEYLCKEEKQTKLDKLGFSWPWADREKIIYKQSTCHLIPRKPLGLVEQRKQLLAKRNLMDNLQKVENPK